jgi:hypothetical protein
MNERGRFLKTSVFEIFPFLTVTPIRIYIETERKLTKLPFLSGSGPLWSGPFLLP